MNKKTKKLIGRLYVAFFILLVVFVTYFTADLIRDNELGGVSVHQGITVLSRIIHSLLGGVLFLIVGILISVLLIISAIKKYRDEN